MRDTQRAVPGAPYRARLKGGPRDGAQVTLVARPYGGPKEFLTLRDEGDGIYLRAGAPHEDGALPYLWMTWTHANVVSNLRFERE